MFFYVYSILEEPLGSGERVRQHITPRSTDIPFHGGFDRRMELTHRRRPSPGPEVLSSGVAQRVRLEVAR